MNHPYRTAPETPPPPAVRSARPKAPLAEYLFVLFVLLVAFGLALGIFAGGGSSLAAVFVAAVYLSIHATVAWRSRP